MSLGHVSSKDNDMAWKLPFYCNTDYSHDVFFWVYIGAVVCLGIGVTIYNEVLSYVFVPLLPGVLYKSYPF